MTILRQYKKQNCEATPLNSIPTNIEAVDGFYTHDLSILSGATSDLIELHTETEIYQRITEQMSALIGEGIIIACSFNEETGQSRIKAIKGIDKYLKNVEKIAGSNPFEMVFLKGQSFGNENAGVKVRNGRLEKIQGGLTELTGNAIPHSIAFAIEKVLNISSIYVMGFTWKGRLFGNIVVFMQNGRELRNPLGVEVYVNQATTIFQRYYAEQALRQAHEELEQRIKMRTAELEHVNRELIIEITERQHATQFARSSEEKYKLLVENSCEAILVCQSDMLTFVNPRAVEITGFTQSELTSQPFISFIHPEDREIVLQRYQARIEGKIVPKHDSFRVQCKNGDIRWVESSSVIINWDDQKATLSFINDVTDKMQAEASMKTSYDKLRSVVQGMIQVMTSIVELRDPYTAGHQVRVMKLACAIGREMALSEDQINGIHASGLVHDIGKMAIPAEILSKPGALNDVEYIMMKTHPGIGYEILKQIEFPWPVAEIVLQHHERMDGSGYPGGITGDKICIEAKILGVADVVESMASHRPYRRPSVSTQHWKKSAAIMTSFTIPTL
jgi:PAS domain S-box-containing protein